MEIKSDEINKTQVVVEKLVEVIDSSKMLGAAWDCISDMGKERLKEKFSIVVDSVFGEK